MKILSANPYNTGIRKNYSSFRGLNKSKKLAVLTAASIASAASLVNETLKMDDKKLSAFLEQQAWSPVHFPYIYYASKEEAQKIRETFISNDKASEIPVLYLGLRDGRLFNDLENKDLSAVPDILVGCESEKNKKFKFGHYDDMLQVIYRFLYVNAEKLENDEFTDELGQIIEYVKEKKNAAFEDVKDSIKESVSDNELMLMTKYYKRNLADKNIKSDLVKSTFENTLVLNRSDVFIADKNDTNYKMNARNFERFLDEQYFIPYRSVNPPVWNATPDEAKIIRKVFKDNGKPEYVLDLYLRDNNEPRISNVLENNLENRDLSAMPDIIDIINSGVLNEKDKYIFSDTVLCIIYDYIYNNRYKLQNDKFTEELGNYADILRQNIDEYLALKPNTRPCSDHLINQKQSVYKYLILKKITPEGNIKADIVKKIFSKIYQFPENMEYRNIDSIISCLKSDDVIESKGRVLNYYDNILNSIPDILPTDVDSNKYNEMLELLKNLPDINYNQKDKYGISIIEKIMNSENLELLNVVKEHNIQYLPELDYVYENIQDEKFKEAIDNVEFDIEELRKLLRKKSPELERHLSSPLIQNNKVTLERRN